MKAICKSLFLPVLLLVLLSCEKEEEVRSYSDCSGSLKMTFSLPGDWNYRTCKDDYMAIEKPDTSYWITIVKEKTNQTSIDSMVNSEKNIINLSKFQILSEGTYKVSDNDAYFFEWYDGGVYKYKVFLTQKDGYNFRFKFSTSDTLVYNKNKDIFDDFINTVVMK